MELQLWLLSIFHPLLASIIETHQAFKIIQVKMCAINFSHKAMLQLGVFHHGTSIQLELELPQLLIYPLLVSTVQVLLASKVKNLKMCGIKLPRRMMLQVHLGDNP